MFHPHGNFFSSLASLYSRLVQPGHHFDVFLLDLIPQEMGRVCKIVMRL
jgi:hypothetical protein